jgi:hypothetical protein
MELMQIQIFFDVPLLELPAAAQEALDRGWTARESDPQSITYSQMFKSHDDFDAALAELKNALGDRVTKIEWGEIAPPASSS